MTRGELKAARYVVATIWLVSGALSAGLYPLADSVLLLGALAVSAGAKVAIVYAGAALDLAMGVLTLAWLRRWLWLAQIAVIVSYTMLATLLVPAYWLHPFGPLLKNLAVLALLWLLYRHEGGGRAA